MDQKAAVDGYLRPDQFLDHLTVIIKTIAAQDRKCNTLVEGSVANYWDELNITWFCGSRESNYLEVTSIMKRATDKKVVL